MNAQEGKVLLIGELTTESIINELKLLGKEYINKLLRSSPDNWNNIAAMLNSKTENISHVFMKLTESSILRCCDNEYFKALRRICVSMKPYYHEIYVFEDNLKYKFNSEVDLEFDDEEYKKLRELDKTRQKSVIDYLVNCGVKIVPYSRRLEISISTRAFLEETTKGLLFRLYVNNEQLWSNEIDKLLSLFSDFLKKTKGFNIILDQTNTQHGAIYSFYCDDYVLDSKNFEQSFNAFTGFLELCANDVNKAISFLKDTNLSNNEIDRIISRYSREARRLAVDIKYEHESRMLAIRHRMHSELIDLVPQDTINHIDKIENPGSLLDIVDPDYVNSFISKVHTVNINNPQIISNVRGIIAKEINGGLNYNEYDEQLLSLFKDKTSSKLEYLQLKTALDELKDETTPEINKVTALQKIKEFTLKAGSSIGQVGLNLLEKYIEKLISGES
ncbi:hypothetical protein LJK88_01555 [Paenibacillus sp. P26]|nr:hypothetical protein LJK88_01555 [Paenibacillus sp. P26]UUZ91096.1 hypothetical protein LJK87_35905 [Paenibacillus sp. P25]